MKKILVTGVNSYIGNSFRSYLEQFPGQYRVDGISCRNGAWKNTDFSGYDCVFHVAGIAHADAGKITPERAKLYYDVNCDMTVSIAEKAKAEGVRQFIFMSSAIIYGDAVELGKRKVIYTDTPPSPAGAYGDSKLQAEKGILPLNDGNFKVVVLRPPMIYGRGSKGNYPVLAKLSVKLPVFPKVDNCRSSLYIENLVEFVRLMIENEEQGTFFPQNREYFNTTELARLVAEAHGKKLVILPGTQWLLQLLSSATPLVTKAFGSLCYDLSISEYKEDYRKFSFAESIKKTEM